jgi:quinoprotein glucose dehydrogenase
VGGAISTAGGVTFVTASMDTKLRAFETSSGRLLWEHELPYISNAIPSTYLTPNNRQIVVVASGGMDLKNGMRPGSFVAFALKKR